jgi:hypothetical protein
MLNAAEKAMVEDANAHTDFVPVTGQKALVIVYDGCGFQICGFELDP